MSEGRIAACVFYLFDHGRELREIFEELEVQPGIVRELWHEGIDRSPGGRGRTAKDDAERNGGAGGSRRRCASSNAAASR